MLGARWELGKRLMCVSWGGDAGLHPSLLTHPHVSALISPPAAPRSDELLRSLAAPPSPPGQDPHGWRVPVDCVRANELCAAEPSCSSRYRTLRQCLAGRDRNTMLANKECQAALEVLQESPLYDCRCKRGMKKELQCLQIYWSIHLGLTEGKGQGSVGVQWDEGVRRTHTLSLRSSKVTSLPLWAPQARQMAPPVSRRMLMEARLIVCPTWAQGKGERGWGCVAARTDLCHVRACSLGIWAPVNWIFSRLHPSCLPQRRCAHGLKHI